MATADRRYYLAEGRDEEIVKEFFTRRDAAFRAAREVAAKHGGAAVTQGWNMAGVSFTDEPPAGWKRIGSTADGKSYYLPERRSKAGKETLKEIRAIRIPGASNLHSEFANDGGVFGEGGPRGGFYIHYITAEIVSGKCIIQVPEKMDFHPPHSRPLKQSEYWQIIEDAKSASSASPS